MSMRTPLKTVRGYGSAKEGASHFYMQRLTGAANVILVPWCVVVIAGLAGADAGEVHVAFAKPWVGVPLMLLVVVGAVHMRLGMAVVIEDYVHAEGLKIVALMLNTFFSVAVAALSAFAILKLSLGG